MRYFYSWRPYKLIVKRLEEVHGIKRRYSRPAVCLTKMLIVSLTTF